MKRNHFIKLFFIFVALMGFFLQPAQKSESPYWWQVELRISTTGDYSYRQNNKGFDGNFSFTSVILGSMHEDDDDYIFLQVHQEIPEMKWKETVFNKDSRKTFNLSEKIKPEVEFNYVFHDKGSIVFDFNVKPVAVPYKCSIFPFSVKQVRFPSSAANGPNPVKIADKDIYNTEEINPVFEWKWERKPGNTSWINRYYAKVTLKIIRLLKKEKS